MRAARQRSSSEKGLLDAARAARTASRRGGAIRRCTTTLGHDRLQFGGTAPLLAKQLVAAGRPELVGDAGARITTVRLRRSGLPNTVGSADVMRCVGRDERPVCACIADVAGAEGPAARWPKEPIASKSHSLAAVCGPVPFKRAEGHDTVVLAGPGVLVGQTTKFVSHPPRADSVAPETSAPRLAVSRGSLEKRAARTPQDGGDELAAAGRARMLPKRLRRRIMRRAVALHDRANLVSPCAAVSLAAGEHLVTLGDEPQGLSPMASGGVRVMGRGADGDELELASWGPGDVVGEAGPVLRRSARADREAAHTSVALVLGREQLQEADKGHSALRAELYDPPAKRVEGMRNIVVQEALRVVREVLS